MLANLKTLANKINNLNQLSKMLYPYDANAKNSVL